MLAIEGIYDNGTISLKEKAPATKAKVLVIFPEKERDKENEGYKKATPEDIAFFKSLAGCIDGEIDPKAEWLSYLEERYASAD